MEGVALQLIVGCLKRLVLNNDIDLYILTKQYRFFICYKLQLTITNL